MRTLLKAGERFGRLVTLRHGDKTPSGKRRWLCQCDCGQQTQVPGNDLRAGRTVSCGCYLAEVLRRDRRHGHAHRERKAPEYNVYIGMIKRCENQKDKRYPQYGGRGITICKRWRDSFAHFLADMGARPSAQHSIDRIGVNGNYEPANCRWATEREQQNNRRDNRIVLFEGRSLTLSQLAELSVVKEPTLRKRLDRGWSVEDAISLPASPISPQRSASRPLERRT